MASKTEIISNAYILLGQGPINDINTVSENDPIVAGISILYDTEKLALLTNYQWKFALKVQELNKLSADSDLSRYQYMYQKPVDMLLPYRSDPAYENYEIYGDRIYSNYSEMTFAYFYDVPESEFPAYFTSYVMYHMAALSGMRVTQSFDITKLWKDAAKDQKLIAQSQDDMSQPSLQLADNPLYNSHFLRAWR